MTRVTKIMVRPPSATSLSGDPSILLKFARPRDDAQDRMFAPEEDPSFDDPLRAEQFDALVQELLPQVRSLWAHLDAVAALRAAARMAEFRMKEDGRLTWGKPRL